ncbi:FtsK/SpoIIIE family DNA translocase [Desulfolucanica intricata]|uniref:FtsK/SpoIIIE family DNA translocase n=1 Tax=Desulfolucanica intricata TaxID=1285191 RepID=UPI000837679C|nr:DNA translocase FtsK [Desulfolucanica intricata]
MLQLKSRIKCEIVGIVLIALGVLAMISLLYPSIGIVGYLMEVFLKAAVGEARFLFPLILGIVGFKLIRKPFKVKKSTKIYGIILMFTVILAFLHMQLAPRGYFELGFKGVGGGLIGAVMIFLMTKSFGTIGAYIILSTLLLVALMLITNLSLITLLKNVWVKSKLYIKKTKQLIINFLYEEIDEEVEEHEIFKTTKIIKFPKQTNKYQDEGNVSADNNLTDEEEKTEPLELSPALNLDFNQDGDGQEKQAAEQQKTVSFQKNQVINGEQLTLSFREQTGNFLLPPLELLQQPSKIKNNKVNKDISNNVKILEETLGSFGVRARVTQVSRGPAITRYEIQPPPGIKVSRIVGLADDIALSMAAPDVRIEAPIPGKAAVGIEVPNKEISRVYLRELLETRDFQQSTSRLTVSLGKDIAGNPIVADLSKMPHLLIAGATGSGKSVCMNTLIASILFKASPEEVKFLIIDPKMVELTTYNGVPHLVSPIVTDPKKAATALRWAVKEMESRYKLFAAEGVKDILRYNKLLQSRKDVKENNKTLPLIVILIDELADLMMVAPADVEDAICRLAQMARAAGIHLVVATQRPSVDVITGLIKANIPSRISFAVSSQIDSRTILDMSGAEKLLGKGDMLFFPIGASKPIRVQGAYLSDTEVENLVNYLKKQSAPVFVEDVAEESVGANSGVEFEDELLPRAVEIFIESGQASISMLQRRLRIGYARAARLIDIMEQKGIVGQFEGSKPRTILINEEDYHQMFNCR